MEVEERELEMFDGVVRQGTISRSQESVGAVLRVVRQLPAQVGSDGSTEVDRAGLLEYFSPLREADRHRGVDDLVRLLPVHSEDPGHGDEVHVPGLALAALILTE